MASLLPDRALDDLRLPSITELDADTLIARFGSTVQRYLTAPLPR